VASTVSVLAFVIPGGLGAREASMAAALAPVMPTAPAVAVAVPSRIVQVALEVVFASAGLLAARRRPGPEAPPRAPEEAQIQGIRQRPGSTP
jgi:glycosyltransferase 2 family protein